MAPCSLCPPGAPRRALIRRPKTGQAVCKECFFRVFETEVHHTILGCGQCVVGSAAGARAKGKGRAGSEEDNSDERGVEAEIEPTRRGLFRRGERVAIGASGGKDSTVLAYIMTLLNKRYDYGLDLCLLSIDEGISGYRDASLDTVKLNAQQYDLPLKILSYSDLYGGWTMDKVVAEVGKKGNCTYCGVFRRQALDRGADLLEVDHIVTGHNADDVAETVLMNVLRGDLPRLERCTAITTGGDPSPASSSSSYSRPDPDADTDESDLSSLLPKTIKRSKPFKYAYEKEIVMYAYFKKLDYHSTECIYAPTAYRGYARALVKDLEAVRPSAIVDLIYSGEAMAVSLSLRGKRAGGDPDPLLPSPSPASSRFFPSAAQPPHRKGITPPTRKKTGISQTQQKCERCGSLTSQRLCQACMLLEGLNRGVARVEVR
ncbi:cytosolic thiouridylase subunit Ctu1 [Rhodotorula toruloides]